MSQCETCRYWKRTVKGMTKHCIKHLEPGKKPSGRWPDDGVTCLYFAEPDEKQLELGEGK